LNPPFTVQTDNTAEQPSEEEVNSPQGFITTSPSDQLKDFLVTPTILNPPIRHGEISPLLKISLKSIVS